MSLVSDKGIAFCATGKTGEEILAALESRLNNEPDDELRVAATEHAQITRIRLHKLAAHPPATHPEMTAEGP